MPSRYKPFVRSTALRLYRVAIAGFLMLECLNLAGRAVGQSSSLVPLEASAAQTAGQRLTLQTRPTSVDQPSGIALLADVGLKIAATNKEKVIAPNQSVLDCGAINLLDRTGMQQTFTLFNANKTPLTVERLQPSCGCMSAVLPQPVNGPAKTKHPAAELPRTLAPGEQMQVQIAIHLDALPAGPFSKSVGVFVQGTARPAAMLQLSGTLQPNVTLTPNVLDFGKVAVGTTPSLILTATFGDRLKTGIPLPRLVSHNPHVQITPLLDQTPPPAQPAGRQGVRMRVQRYRVTLQSGLEAGALSDTLSLA